MENGPKERDDAARERLEEIAEALYARMDPERAVRLRLLTAVGQVAESMREELHRKKPGEENEDARNGVLVKAMIRGIDRIGNLPDDRPLTDDEVQLFQSGLIQTASAALVLLGELPLPGGEFVVAAFDTSNPQ